MNNDHIGTHIAAKWFSMAEPGQTEVPIDEHGLALLIQLGVRYAQAAPLIRMQETACKKSHRHNGVHERR